MEDLEITNLDLLNPAQQELAVGLCRRRGATKGLVVDAWRSRVKKMKKTVVTAARLIQDRISPCGRESAFKAAMVTLTYEDTNAWDPNHIRAYLTHVRNWMNRRKQPFRYVWTAELQERGAVHYHIVVWLPKLGPGQWNYLKLPKADDAGWWPHGSSNVKWARSAVGYIAKYASKGSELPQGKKFPKGCRLYGVGGVTKDERVTLRYYRAPPFARDALGPNADIFKVEEGYVDRRTGLFVKSPWVFVSMIGKFPLFIWQPT